MSCKQYIRKIRRLAGMYTSFVPLQTIADKKNISKDDLKIFASEVVARWEITKKAGDDVYYIYDELGDDFFNLMERGDAHDTTESVGETPISLTERTNNLQLWFGNSSVCDKHGNPAVMHHGTMTDFEEFAYGDIGYHFGTATQAENRIRRKSETQIIDVYLKISNPLTLPDAGMWHKYQAVLGVLDGAGVINEYEDERIRYAHDPLSEARKVLEEKGYDGIRYKNEVEGKGWSWIAFRSNQIKAVENEGHFNPDSSNIYE